MAKQGNESTDLLLRFRVDKSSGAIVKRFKDEYIVFDLLKILYEDDVDSNVKTELLIDLEEYGHYSLTSESVDQVVTSLLDIVSLQGDDQTNWSCVCQSLITSTSLLIQLDQLETEICKQLVKTLISIVTNINQADNQRVRSCACHCLIHMEEFQPGLLFAHHDEFARLARQERTCIYQDYALLAAKVLENIGRMSVTKLNSQTSIEKEQISSKQMMLQKQLSYDIHDIRQFTAFLVENTGLMSRCGYFRMIQSVAEIVKTSSDISPMLFKPLMLHQMSTVSCVIFQTIMFLQREFQGQILTEKEQAEFLHRLCIMTDHPCLTLLNKLLVSHWAKLYYLDEGPAGDAYRNIIQRLRFKFYPSVFDPVDCQLSKLIMTSLCGNLEDDDDGLETSVLLGSLGYIHKLAWHTGCSRVAIVLFKALYYMFQSRNDDSFSSDIQRFLRGLCTDLPHFIPHTTDFLDSIQELNLNSTIYVETLDLLHKQVVMATDEQIERSYYFYLQILKKAACEKQISQASSLQFLQNLACRAQYMSEHCWNLGHSILEICRNFLLFQGTDQYYTETPSKDDEVKKYANPKLNVSFWDLVTLITTLLGLCFLIYVMLKVYQKGIVLTNHRAVYLISTLIGCFVSGVMLIAEVVGSVFREYDTLKSWHACFYIEVVKMTASDWIGACLALTFINTLYCLHGNKEDAETDDASLRIFVHVSNVLAVVMLCVINSAPEHFYNDFPSTLNICSRREVFAGHIDLVAKLDLIVKSIVIFVLMAAMVSAIVVIKYKLVSTIVDEYSNGQTEMAVKCLDILSNKAPIADTGYECQSISSDSSLCDKGQANKPNLQYALEQWNMRPNTKFRRKRFWSRKRSEYKGEMDSDKAEGNHVSRSLGEKKLSRRSMSLSATQETLVADGSPAMGRKSLSVQYLENEHVLHALDNFFISDPTSLQLDIKTKRKNKEQAEALFEQETGFSTILKNPLSSKQSSDEKRGKRRVSWKDINSDKDDSPASPTKVEDVVTRVEMASNMDTLALVKHQFTNQDCFQRQDVDITGTANEPIRHDVAESDLSNLRSPELADLKGTEGSVIAVDVQVHHELHGKGDELELEDNADSLNDVFDDQEISYPNTNDSMLVNLQKMNVDLSDARCRIKTGDFDEAVKDKGSTCKNDSQSASRSFAGIDQSEFTSTNLDQSVSIPCQTNQSNPSKGESHARSVGVEAEMEIKIEDTDADCEQVSVDDGELSEVLTFKENLKMIGKMSHTIMWLSVIYTMSVVLSLCYALLVISEGIQSASTNTFRLLVDLGKGGQLTFILVYTAMFAWRFGLFHKDVRK